VILSQLFRGLAQGFDGVERVDPQTLARAMQQASATAYKAVIRPVEGTILSVARRCAEAGLTACADGLDLRGQLERVVQAGAQAVADTPSQLAVLAEAGVVDAGGQGLYILLEGMQRYLHGEGIVPAETLEEQLFEVKHVEGAVEEYGYDVQFILQGTNLDVDQIRSQIDAMGTSTLVVGDGQTVKVHVHTVEPGKPLDYGASLGSMSRIIVENLEAQARDFYALKSPAAPPALPRPAVPATGIGIIAVVPGEGLARVFESLGAARIVPGGQTMNPSTEELFNAIEETGTDEVIILPNNKNVTLTAQQAQRLSGRRVCVVPTRSIPQGIGALLAFNYQADLDTNAKTMEQALGSVQTGEITRAVRSVKINGLQVGEDEIIGLLNGDLVAAGEALGDVMMQVLEKMGADELEIITLYYGDEVTEREARTLASKIAERYAEQEIEVVEGGQPHYQYIVSGE